MKRPVFWTGPWFRSVPVRHLCGVRGRVVLCLVAVALSFLPRTAAAQEVSTHGKSILLGQVRSLKKGKPVVGARVFFPSTDVDGLTDEKGMFRIDQLPAGELDLLAEYLEFESDTVAVSLLPGVATYVTLTLQTEPVELPTLRVEASRVLRDLRLVAYYERLRQGRGYYITREDLARRDVVSNIRRVPGARMDQCLGPGGVRQTSCWTLRIARGAASTGAACPAELWLDGHQVTSSRPSPQGVGMVTLLQSLPRHLIEGIEVYRNASQAPAQYRGFGACGVILIWTHRG